jgi:hypothetical protein
MAQLVATEKQSPNEVLRYLLDYTLDLNTGESLSTLTCTVTSTTDNPPTLVINNIALAPAVSGQITQATFFASLGKAGNSYEASFLATTTLGQVFESVVAFNIVSFQ